MVSDISPSAENTGGKYPDVCGYHRRKYKSGEEERRFLSVMRGQVKKLEFLVQALVKMSRLESNMLVLKKENALLFDTLSRAVSSILPAADKKNIELNVRCPQKLRLFHDPKWTEEAIFNVLDNAVKYTPPGGAISITVESLQIYTRLMVSDTGIGIEPSHQNDIFKRFYREEKVRRESGVGIGLYLTRRFWRGREDISQSGPAPGRAAAFHFFCQTNVRCDAGRFKCFEIDTFSFLMRGFCNIALVGWRYRKQDGKTAGNSVKRKRGDGYEYSRDEGFEEILW